MAAFVPTDLRIYRFHPGGLDPIAIYVEQFGPRSSRMTVQCFSRAWTAYWGAHGDEGLEVFVTACDADYIADGLASLGLHDRLMRQYRGSDRNYLLRIVRALQAEFAARAAGAASPPQYPNHGEEGSLEQGEPQ